MKKLTTIILFVLFIHIGTTGEVYGEVKKVNEIKELKLLVDSYYNKQSYSEALLKSLELLTLSQQENDIATEIFAYTTIAECYGLLGEYEMALHQFTNALQLMSSSNDPLILATLYARMSKLLIDLGRHEQALEMVEKGLLLVDMDNAPKTVIKLKFNHSALLILDGKHSKALSILMPLRGLVKKTGDIHRYSLIENNIGMLQKFEKEYDKAIQTFNNLLSYTRSNNLKQMEVYSLLELGDIDRIQKRFIQGRNNLKKIDTLLKSDANLNWRSFQLSYLLALEKDAGNPVLASEYQTKLNKLKPKLSNLSILNRLELMKTNLNVVEYKSKVSLLEKDKHIQAQEVELQRLEQRNLLLIVSVLLLLVLAFAFYQNHRRQVATLIHQQKENDRKVALERAELMSKLVENKNKLLADVSHELRTPLTVLKLQVEALQHNLDDDVEASYHALDEKLSDIGRLISDIYQLAKSDIGALELNFCDLEFPETIVNWVNEFELLVTSNNLTWQFNNQLDSPTTINADEDRIKQVLSNLINNSVKYTDQPGKVTLSVNAVEQYIVIIIEDTSPSVPAELQSQIFERLYRVEESRSRQTGGSGLGLAICKSLVEAHNGIITAETSNIGGLKTTLLLPINTY